ncbi:transglutaminase-like superfamily protein, partial [Chlamydia psittaci 08DC60]
MIMQKLKNIF